MASLSPLSASERRSRLERRMRLVPSACAAAHRPTRHIPRLYPGPLRRDPPMPSPPPHSPAPPPPRLAPRLEVRCAETRPSRGRRRSMHRRACSRDGEKIRISSVCVQCTHRLREAAAGYAGRARRPWVDGSARPRPDASRGCGRSVWNRRRRPCHCRHQCPPGDSGALVRGSVHGPASTDRTRARAPCPPCPHHLLYSISKTNKCFYQRRAPCPHRLSARAPRAA